jgi:hypothetical protein
MSDCGLWIGQSRFETLTQSVSALPIALPSLILKSTYDRCEL